MIVQIIKSKQLSSEESQKKLGIIKSKIIAPDHSLRLERVDDQSSIVSEDRTNLRLILAKNISNAPETNIGGIYADKVPEETYHEAFNSIENTEQFGEWRFRIKQELKNK